jgi:rhamnose transport system permease protein
MTRLRELVRWEVALVFLLLATIALGAHLSPAFTRPGDVFYIGVNTGEIAIMAIPLALIVITGEIDLSVASMLGLAGAVMGYLFSNGVQIWPSIGAALVVGVIAGAFNGFLVTRIGLPSLAVTIGTLTLYRGIAQILLPNNTIGGFPASLTKIGIFPIPHTQIPYSMAFFAVFAAIAAVVLHATPLGRSIFAIGANQEAAFFSGIRVKRIKMGLYILSGFLCSIAGVLWTLKFASARYDAGTGLELNVVTVVLLAGVSIFGGRGTILGVVLSVFILGALQQGLTLDHVAAQNQSIVIGALLIVSVIVPNSSSLYARARERVRSGGARRRVRAGLEQ